MNRHPTAHFPDIQRKYQWEEYGPWYGGDQGLLEYLACRREHVVVTISEWYNGRLFIAWLVAGEPVPNEPQRSYTAALRYLLGVLMVWASDPLV